MSRQRARERQRWALAHGKTYSMTVISSAGHAPCYLVPHITSARHSNDDRAHAVSPAQRSTQPVAHE